MGGLKSQFKARKQEPRSSSARPSGIAVERIAGISVAGIAGEVLQRRGRIIPRQWSFDDLQ